ncbi:MAG: OsmC family protein [Armatimonadetes bacterium]|nr:OsmC family protein [Armatimonadota bacterium]
MADVPTVSVTLDHTGDMAYDAALPDGHTLTFDSDADFGGRNSGPRPIDVLLASLGGCTAMDVISILRKMKQPVEGYRLLVEGRRAADHPRVYTHITITHILTGDIDEERLAHAIQLSDEKYCSVGAMLTRTARIETTFRIERP